MHDGGMAHEVEPVMREFRRTALALLATATGAITDELGAETVRGHVVRRVGQEAEVLAGNAVTRRDAARRFADQYWRATVESARRAARHR
jgi:hypothetical protein